MTNGNGDVKTLSTGVNVRIVNVPSLLIQQASIKIKDPPVPMQKIEGKDYPVSNPTHPDYLRELSEAQTQRGYARIDTILLFGLELVDGLPEDDTWLRKLKFMDKQGYIDLSSYDLEDEVELEFVYKKFIAIGNKIDDKGFNVDLTLVTNIGVNEEAIAEASELFPDDTNGSGDTPRRSKKS